MERCYKKGQTKKDFLSYFPAVERQFHTGFPILKKDSFDFKTPPTFHFKLHWFDYLKKVNIQMGSRKYTKSKKSVAEIEQSIELEQSKMKKKPKKQKKIKKTLQVCQNPKCGKEFEGFSKLMTHVLGKRNKVLRCIKYYGEHNILNKLISDAKNEKTFHKRTKTVAGLKRHLISAKNDLIKEIFEKFDIRIEQNKNGGGSCGNVENGETAMKALARKNREDVLNLFHTVNDKEREDLDLMLDQALVIISVTNRIWKIKVQEFQNFVKESYSHWLKAFKKFQHIKSSLHWTLSHIGQLIALNESYSLAEVSENSIEKIIKPYKYITTNNARQTSMAQNNIDCLRALYLQTHQDIRQLDKPKKPRESDDDISKLIFLK